MAQQDRQWQKTTTDTDGTPRTTMAQRQRRQWHTKNNDGTTTKTTMAQQQRPGVDPHARTSNAAAMMSRKGARQKRWHTKNQRWHTKNNAGTPRTTMAHQDMMSQKTTTDTDGTPRTTMAQRQRRSQAKGALDHAAATMWCRSPPLGVFAFVRHSPVFGGRRCYPFADKLKVSPIHLSLQLPGRLCASSRRPQTQ